jgi:peptidoglycan/LPS O-acetylase OafA/YrhL
LSEDTHDAMRTTTTPYAVDNTDWLKTFAIILVLVGHFGHFFVEDDRWWSTFGRLAAAPFFFLLGYAHTRTIPLSWIWIGVVLTALESSNDDWRWVAPNILLSLALIRLARPYLHSLLQHYGWLAFALLALTLVAVAPFTGKIVDYGAEGWLWALFGLCQRMYLDSRSAGDGAHPSAAQSSPTTATMIWLMRVVACLVAVAVYIWQEQVEFRFRLPQLATFIATIGILAAALCLFRRGRSRIQPPQPIAGTLRFIGHYTLEIYAIELAAFELIIKLWPDLAAG